MELAELSDVAIQSVKRLEKKGFQPRYSTINKVREKFKEMGLNFSINDDGEIKCKLTDELIEAINTGELRIVIDKYSGKIHKELEEIMKKELIEK